jgi:hypothetical protein
MAVASTADLALLRTDGGRIGTVTDPAISNRVCSYRLAPSANSSNAWAFRKDGWKAFAAGGINILDQGDLPFMCRTDITKFYPSVRTDRLRELLLKRGCNAAAVRRVIGILESWQTDALSGLPIGPEASAVLANFFLDSVDRSIISAGADHKRYSDDILIFTEARPIGEAVVTIVDSNLSLLQLQRSEEKTKYFDDPQEARNNLRDIEIDSLEGAIDDFPQLQTEILRRRLIERSNIRWR